MLNKNTGIILIFIFSFIVAISIIFNDVLRQYFLALGSLSLIGYGLISWIGLYSKTNKDKKYIKSRFWFAFLFLLSTAVIWYIILNLVEWKGYDGFFYDDELRYDGIGKKIANSLTYGLSYGETSNFYFIINGYIYYLFDHYPLIPRFYNCLFGALTAASSYIISIELYNNRRVARFTFWLVTLAPLFVFWSISQMREIQMAFCLAIITGFTLVFMRKASIGLLMILLLAYYYLYILRPVMILFPLIGTVLYLIRCFLYTRTSFMRIRVFLMIILTMSLFLYLLGYLDPVFNILDDKYHQIYVSSLEKTGRHDTDAVSLAVLGEKSFSVYNVFTTLFSSFLIPSPVWVLTSYNFFNIVSSVQGLAWYFIIPFFFLGLIYSFKNIENPAVVFVSSICVAAFLGGTFTYLTVVSDPVRFRFPSMPIFAVFAGYGYHLYQYNRTARKYSKPFIIFFIIVIFLISILYIVLKVNLILSSLVTYLITILAYLAYKYFKAKLKKV